MCVGTGSKGWRGMGQFPKDQDLVGLLCRIRAAKPGQTTLWRLKEARDIPIRCSVGLWCCYWDNRVWPVPCEEEKRGLRPAGPLLLLTPPVTARSGVATKFFAPEVAAQSLWMASLCVAKST